MVEFSDLQINSFKCEVKLTLFFPASKVEEKNRGDENEQALQNYYESKSDLHDYIIEQSRDKHLKCKVCLKSFRFQQDLNTHITGVHENEKPNKCEVCLKTFVYRYTSYEADALPPSHHGWMMSHKCNVNW